MKLKLVLASLILASSHHLFAEPENVNGKVGSVTLAFTVSHEEESDPKTITNSSTVLKTRTTRSIVSEKYNTKAFIEDLISKYELTGKVSDWSVKYVESQAAEFAGFFLVSKTGEIKCIGGDVGYFDGPSDELALFRISNGPIFTYLTEGAENITINRVSNEPVSGITETKFKNQSIGYFGFSPASEVFSFLLGNATGSGSEKTSYTIDGETETTTASSYSVGEYNVKDIVGFGEAYDAFTVKGSLSISALKDTSDVSAYRAAWNAVFNVDV